MFLIFFSCFLMVFLNFYKMKLIVLLSLEGLLISCIFVYFFVTGSGSTCIFFPLFFTVFMVLDSVLGLSCLLGDCRDSSFASHQLL
uniref:NADH dehydrogenase subunit 4L n=1 Tax=Epitrimerus sabinae TaxID=1452570 RepID=A0A0U2NKJ8_9ACAR|nr:NADH dehydrogenase subunit 4L [Epitrimerus sabinae]ALK03791.1 NADH dehydrogenase subunit 4L [Epitrimerus sabinae]